MKNFLPMRLLFILLIMGTVFQPLKLNAQVYNFQKGTVYIVRHSEKDTGNDPRLSIKGNLRSGHLAKALLQSHKINLDRIYVSPFRRTQLTADSIRLKYGVDTVHYAVDNLGNGLLNVMQNYTSDKQILVIGHSNTIPAIIKRMGFPQINLSIADDEYNNIYMITFKGGKAKLYKKNYGDPAIKGANSKWTKML